MALRDLTILRFLDNNKIRIMKQYLLKAFICLIFTGGYAQVGIGTTEPSPSSMLEISSTADNGTTYKGLMPPRLPNIEARNSINVTAADTGLLIYLQDTGCLQMWNGNNWESIKCADATVPQLLASWDFSGRLGDEPLLSADFNVTEIFRSSISRGSGIEPAAKVDYFNANKFTQPTLIAAVANNDFFEFTITPKIGSSVTVTSLFLNYERSNTGPALGAIRSSADGFTSNIFTFNSPGNAASFTVDTTGHNISDQTGKVSFRVYLYGNSNVLGSGSFGGNRNDIEIYGIVN